jgi:hypothetical protein
LGQVERCFRMQHDPDQRAASVEFSRLRIAPTVVARPV